MPIQWAEPKSSRGFWKGSNHGPLPAGRLAAKRAAGRTLCLLAVLVLIYHLCSSVELRDSLRQVRVGKDGYPAASPSARPAVQTAGGFEDKPVALEEVLKEVNGKAAEDGEQEGAKVTVGKEKATLLMLARNRELRGVLSAMRMVEDRFNRKYKYPWTFMNDKPFSPDFKAYTSGLASGPVEYIQLPTEHWSVPEHINTTLMHHNMWQMQHDGVIYGGSLSYRHMCRFNSGFFYQQEALKKYDWYWRVEPNIQLFCDLTYDPFTFMREKGKVYGWVLSMYEFKATIPTLWARTKEFIARNTQFLAKDNALNWIVDGGNATEAYEKKEIKGDYNLCHFWSNFEIASLEFYRSEAYQKYFEHLDKAGGFFYERWGDAPVHSIAASLFLPKDKIHHFADIGYFHAPVMRCPMDEESHASGRCVCERNSNFDLDNYSCSSRWFLHNGVGKGAVFPQNSRNEALFFAKGGNQMSPVDGGQAQ